MRFIIWVCLILSSMTYHQSAQAQRLCQREVDIGFLLDSSGSIRQHYDKEKTFVKSIATAFFHEDSTRASVITFSKKAELSIKLNKYTNSKDFNKAVDGIKFKDGTTRIDLALRLAQREMFITKNGGRSGISKVVVLLTDGKQTTDDSHEKPEKIAEELRKAGMKLIVVGMGTALNSAELTKIAGGANRVFKANTFKQLLSSNFIQSVSTQVCNDIKPEICHVKVDAGFLLDSSGSLEDHYKDEKKFIKSVAGIFGLGKDLSRASVITFSKIATHSIKLSDYVNIVDFSKAVDKIALMREHTRIDSALLLAQKEMFTKANGGRDGLLKVLVLITDGKQSEVTGYQDPAPIAAKIRNSGVELIAIGIGDQVDPDELTKIAGRKDRVFVVKTFEELLGKKVHDFIKEETCRYREFLKKFVGVWSVTYKTTYYYTITNDGYVRGSPTDPFIYAVVMSDQQKIFPSSGGWLKADGGKTGIWFYFRVGQDGQLEIRYFGKSFTDKYGSLPNYFGTVGVGKMMDFTKKVIGDWDVKYDSKTITYIITKDGNMIWPDSKLKSGILISDNEKVFPSSHGWLKSNGAGNKYIYFRLKYDNSLEIHLFGPTFKKTYKGLPNYYGSAGVGAVKFQRLVGVWDIKYTYLSRYTITDGGIVLGDFNSPFQLVKSDNEKVFPTSDGWFKGIGGKRGTYLYCRVNKAGKLESIYFGPTYTYKYKTLPNYFGTAGVGEKFDLLPKVVGKWNVKYKTTTYVLTITPQGILLGFQEGPFKIGMSDNQNIFPSGKGWLKAVNGINNAAIYFQLYSNDDNTLDVIYFAPKYEYKYQNLPGYYGTRGTGKRIVLPWVKEASSLCYSAKSLAGAGKFHVSQTGLVESVKLVHVSGSIKCNGGKTKSSYWGCVLDTEDCNKDNSKDNCLGTVIIDSSYHVVVPTGVKFSRNYDYNLNAYGNKHDGNTLILPVKQALNVTKGDEYAIVLGITLVEKPGIGKHCVDAYFRYLKDIYLQKMVGAWSVTYGSPTKYHYAVTRDMIFQGTEYWNIVASDNQTIFPSKDGWYKAIWYKANGTHFYVRLSTGDKLEILYFKKSYTGTYKTLKHYYGKPGIGIRY